MIMEIVVDASVTNTHHKLLTVDEDNQHHHHQQQQQLQQQHQDQHHNREQHHQQQDQQQQQKKHATTDRHQCCHLVAELSKRLEPAGFECHPFLVGWYNDSVAASFRLPLSDCRLACVVLSTPAMFERTFVPWLRANCDVTNTSDVTRLLSTSDRDPLDSCMRQVIGVAAHSTSPSSVVLHDFDTAARLAVFDTSAAAAAAASCRRPAVLMQPAAHVAAAARYFCRADAIVNNNDAADGGEDAVGGDAPVSGADTDISDPWPLDGRVYGVCLHPVYGGWFAIRAVVVFDIDEPNLPRRQPPRILNSVAGVRRLLRLFNNNWQDWRYRDILGANGAPLPPHLRYSPLQRCYFETVPAQRGAVMRRILANTVADTCCEESQHDTAATTTAAATAAAAAAAATAATAASGGDAAAAACDGGNSCHISCSGGSASSGNIGGGSVGVGDDRSIGEL